MMTEILIVTRAHRTLHKGLEGLNIVVGIETIKTTALL